MKYFNPAHFNNKIIVLILLLFSATLFGQHLYQLPKPLQDKSEFEKIIGPITTNKPAKELNVLCVYGYDKHHIAGAHDYVKVKDLMIDLLSKVPGVTIEEAFHFPSDEQFEKADLVAMYLHLPQLEKSQYASFKNYIKNGGGVISLHETAIMRPANDGKLLSECLGSAWNEGTSKWGAIFDEINIDNRHAIFKGFPEGLTINDEFYWNYTRKKASKSWELYGPGRMKIVTDRLLKSFFPRKNPRCSGYMNWEKAKYSAQLLLTTPLLFTILNSG